MREEGLSPSSRARFDDAPSSSPSDASEVLINAAIPELEQLRRSLNSPDWAVLCIDPMGTIIRSIYEPSSGTGRMSLPLVTGGTVLEKSIGTSAPGCVLAERRPTVVRGPEHYLTELSDFVCVAAPIFGADGSLAGVLDVTGAGSDVPGFLTEHVALSARAIQNRMLYATPNTRLFGIHVMQSFLGTAAEGILAVCESTGHVVAVNDAACAILNRSRQQIVGSPLDQIVDRPAPSALSDEVTTVVITSSGRRLFLREHGKAPRAAMRSIMAEEEVRDLSRGDSKADSSVERALETGRRASSRRLSVLILGETGSGKEVAARAIHASCRGDQPFVALNCAALPESLMEAELFGYADGAFTGGRKGGNIGIIERADGGTLFLDEIGDAPLTLQSKLLRVIQEGSLCRLGSRREIKVQLSIISATHRDLGEMIKNGQFREDLYYRLNTLSIELPPLRERSDRRSLVAEILRQQCGGQPLPELTERAMNAVLMYSWPGNVRQLAQALAVAQALADNPSRLDVDDLPEYLRPQSTLEFEAAALTSTPDVLSFKESRSWLARKALRESNNNASEAARRLKISRTTLYKYLKDSPI